MQNICKFAFVIHFDVPLFWQAGLRVPFGVVMSPGRAWQGAAPPGWGGQLFMPYHDAVLNPLRMEQRAQRIDLAADILADFLISACGWLLADHPHQHSHGFCGIIRR